MKGGGEEEHERQRERERSKGGEKREKDIDSLIHIPLPVSAECQDLPPGKTNHKAEVMDVALQDLAVLPSGWSTPYISLMHSKLNLHLDGFPRPHPAQMQPKAALHPGYLNGFDLSFPGLLCKNDVGPCTECQHDVTVAIGSYYMQPNGC